MIKYKTKKILAMVMRLFNGKEILDNKRIKEVIYYHTKDLTFKEIHDNFKWNLNITVTDSHKTDEGRLLNYLTAPNVVVWSAACASSAIPLFYEPIELMIKDENGKIRPYHPNCPNQKYVDGTIASDLPMQRMSELFNVNTFIVSQVNPHVIPFVSVDGGGILNTRMRLKFFNTCKTLIGNEVKHFISQMDTIGALPTAVKRLSTLLTQSYKGHVTIIPAFKVKDYLMILQNPSKEEFK